MPATCRKCPVGFTGLTNNARRQSRDSQVYHLHVARRSPSFQAEGPSAGMVSSRPLQEARVEGPAFMVAKACASSGEDDRPAPILSFHAATTFVDRRFRLEAVASMDEVGAVRLACALPYPRRTGHGRGRWLHRRRLAFESASFRVTFLFTTRCVWARCKPPAGFPDSGWPVGGIVLPRRPLRRPMASAQSLEPPILAHSPV